MLSPSASNASPLYPKSVQTSFHESVSRDLWAKQSTFIHALPEPQYRICQPQKVTPGLECKSLEDSVCSVHVTTTPNNIVPGYMRPGTL